MNKKTFTLMVACLFVIKAMAQQVEQVQRTLLTKVAATWCPPCGSWGWAMFDGLVEDNEGKAIFLTAHHSGNLVTTEGTEIAQNFGATYQPRFYINETDLGVNSSNYATKRSEVQALVNVAFNSSPVANVGFEPIFENSTLKVDAKVKFFQPTDGDFYLGIYLIEDGVIEYQASIGSEAVHKKILRYGFTDETFGQPIFNGTVNADSEYDLSFGLELGAVEGYDYEVAGIIWKKENNKYIPVNVWSTKEIGSPSFTSDVPGINSFDIAPNITADQAVITLDLQNNQPHGSLDMIDINGKKMATISHGAFTKGVQTYILDKSMISANGLYFIRFSDGNNVSTKRVVFQ